MTRILRPILSVSAIAVLSGALTIATADTPPPDAEQQAIIAEGKKITFDRRLGNCLACHHIDDGEFPGNIGPPLMMMPQRYPDKERLRQQIYDPTIANPYSVMPPFGKHGILSEAQIDKIVEYLYTL